MSYSKKIVQLAAITLTALILSACIDWRHSSNTETGSVQTKQQIKVADKTYNIVVENEVKRGRADGYRYLTIDSVIRINGREAVTIGSRPLMEATADSVIYGEHQKKLRGGVYQALTEAGMSQELAKKFIGQIVDEIIQDIKETKLAKDTDIAAESANPNTEVLGTIWDFSNQQTLNNTLENDSWH